MITHKHHIIPKHTCKYPFCPGYRNTRRIHTCGLDESSNKIDLLLLDHAIAHKVLYGLYGRWQDKYAWLMLSNKTEEGEKVRIEAVRDRMINHHPLKDAKIRAKLSASKKGCKAWNKGIQKQYPTKNCEWCGMRFSHYKINEARFCSRSCFMYSRNNEKDTSGKRWITNGVVEKMIQKTSPIPNGFIIGRNKS